MTELGRKIKEELSNVPDDVVEVWLEPLVPSRGWPVDENNELAWNMVFDPITYKEARTLKWETEPRTIRLPEVNLTPFTNDNVDELMHTAIEGEDEGDTQRFKKAFSYLVEYGVFPRPPVFYEVDLMRDSKLSYFIFDGMHRLSAHRFWLQEWNKIKLMKEPEKEKVVEKLKKALNVKNVLVPKNEQKIWVASL